MAVQLSRDPFARVTVVRESIPAAARRPCGWCGSAPGRFRYGIDPDAGRVSFYPGGYCGIGCYRVHADVSR